jgi:predicted TIM-barrel fold metal-dependent hydrolase
MSKGNEALLDEQSAEETIIDADFHLQIPNEAFFPYVRDDAVREKMEAHGAPEKTYMGWKGTYASETDSVGNAQGIAATSEEVIESRKDMGIDVTIVNAGLKFPNAGRYPTIMNELTRAYNDYVLEEVVDTDNGVFATLLLPVWDVDFTVQELERVGDHEGFVGAHQWFSRAKPFGAIEYDPIYEKLVELDLPLTLHPSAAYSSRFSQIGDTMRSYVEVSTTAMGHVMMASVMNMIMTGLFEKFPDFEVVIQEAGTLWIPYAAYRGDEIYRSYPEDVALVERMQELDRKYLEKQPSECIFENMYTTTQPIALPDRSDLAEAALKLTHADEMYMFSSDWPHGTVDAPNWMFENNKIDDSLRSRIAHENAAEVYRLPDDAIDAA